MGRIGLSFEDVSQAAQLLQAQGKAPTVDAVREHLGTGSKTTISYHLKQWKSQQGAAQGSLPSELLNVVTGLWERLQAETAQTLTEASQMHQAECQLFQSTITDTRDALIAAEQQIDELSGQYQIETTRSQNLEIEGSQLKQALLQLETRYQGSESQVADLKAENMRLHQLATQIQTNLEHYQQAIEQLRIEQALENEKQLAIHHQQLMLQTEKANALSYELENKTNAIDSMGSELCDVRKLVDVLRETSRLHENEKLISQERVRYLEKSLAEKSQQEEIEKSEVETLKLQFSQLLQQNQRLQTTVEHLLKKQENLEGEKAVLKKEKNQLQLSILQPENSSQ